MLVYPVKMGSNISLALCPKQLKKVKIIKRYYTDVLALCRVSGLLWNNSWNMKGLRLLAISPECL